MNDNQIVCSLFKGIGVFAIVLVTIGFITKAVDVWQLKKEAINLGYASYNPTNGHWQWHVAK
jgi:tRNA G37 N-methylase Trm5